MKILRNIACVQINLDDNGTDFYFPDNVLFHDKVIDSIMLYAAPAGVTMRSPFDGRTVIDHALLNQFYMDVSRGNKDILHQAVNALECDMTGNAVLKVGQTVDFTLTRLSFYDTASTSLSGLCVMAYVTFYGYEDKCDPECSVTVHVNMSEDRMLIADVLDEWIQRAKQTFKGVSANYATGNEFYLSLRETTGKVFEYVPSQYIKDNDGQLPVNNHPVSFDFNLDFKDSWIVNAMGSTIEFDLTFYY